MSKLSYSEIQFYINKNILPSKEFNVFVETGTFIGETLQNVNSYFEEVHSIELSENFYVTAVNNFKKHKNIYLHFGDSSKVLPEVIKHIQKDTIFFLDGHWSNGNTAKGEKDCPLLEELKILYDEFAYSSIIIIDDYKLFGTKENEDWSYISVENILKIVVNRLVNLEINNNRLVLYMGSEPIGEVKCLLISKV